MPHTLKMAQDLHAEHAQRAAAMADSLAAARIALADENGAAEWQRVADAIRQLERGEKPLPRRRG